jgi:hypothetical protein
MNRVYHHHEKWEDYLNGQYALTYAKPQIGELQSAALLADGSACYAAMSVVTREWPNATEHNLTNLEQNRRAWLGQAACCFELGVPAFVTKAAWWTLPVTIQDRANAIADSVIREWEVIRRDAETLFRD